MKQQVINADPHGKIALQGYDPVGFHTAGKAIKGNPAISVQYRGFKYLFSAEENKAAFEKDPLKYLPAYGGYCAYGAALGILFPVEIDTWEIIDGRLALQFSLAIKQKFDEERYKNIRRADANWSKIEESFSGFSENKITENESAVCSIH